DEDLMASDEDLMASDVDPMASDEDLMASDEETTMVAPMASEDLADQNDPHHFAEDIMGLSDDEVGIDPKLARIFSAGDEMQDATGNEGEDVGPGNASEEDGESASEKSASFRPQTTARQSSVKTLGNISREASSASDELSKLWESAPDVSKFF
ncbi:MAG: hypothetical protein HOJ16_05240, partial [Candidatus Peribacter sp.]|nr:hypothetical protein [Candidatus Peribacter sp.]